MVSKKALKAVNRNEVILAILVLGIVAFVFAMAPAANMTSPKSGGNYTGWINVSCFSGMEDAVNATVYYNESGGAITHTPTYIMGAVAFNNSWADGSNVSHINVSVNTALYPDSTRYNISCTLCNSTDTSTGGCVNSSTYPINVTFDNTNPRVIDLTIDGSGDGSYKNGSTNSNLVLNVSVNDSGWVVNGSFSAQMMGIESVHFNLTNSNEEQINFTFGNNHSANEYGSYYNASLNISTLPDGIYNLSVHVNGTNMTDVDTALGLTQINTTTSIQFTVDSNAPSVTYTCSPSSISVGQITTCTCVGDDGAGSGINSTADDDTGSSTASVVTEITGTVAVTDQLRTCTVEDRVGKTASATATYTVTDPVGATDGGSSGGVASSSATTTTTTAVMGNFEEDTGVEEIEVRVSAQVTNAEVTVTRYDTKPIEVSIAKPGEVYQYIQIETRNFADKLVGATMTIKVEKDWVNAQGIAKERVSVFRFDENSAEKWDELTTSYDREDAGYYYYGVELDSFSYFAISETVVVEDVPEPPEPEPTRNLTWLWIVIGVVVVAVVVGGGFAVKKKR